VSALAREPGNDEWLTISEASSLVGVSVATLRRWSDAGEVRTFTTPGGHRRFSRDAVLGLARAANARLAGVSCNGETEIRLVRAYRRELRRWSDDGPAGDGLPERLRDELREQGIQIVSGLLGLLDNEPRDAARHSAAARAASYRCGRVAADCRMSLDDTVALFIRLRAPFIHQLGIVLRGQARDAADTTAVLEAASEAFDQLLPAMMAGFVTGGEPGVP
jgi:excisionase family DNA binding protein